MRKPSWGVRAAIAMLGIAAAAAPAVGGSVPTCGGRKATIVGTGKADTIEGTPRDDVILGRAGNDEIYGRGGNDRICAGWGEDTVYGGGGADRVLGGPRPDRWLDGGPGDDKVDGGEDGVGSSPFDGESGAIVGGPGNDVLKNADDKRLYTGVGYTHAPGPIVVDFVDGIVTGDGTDTLVGVRTVTGSAYNDTFTGDGRCVALGHEGDDTVTGCLVGKGGAGDDTITIEDGPGAAAGGPGDDQIFGSAEGDHISGDAGNDELHGNGGDDHMQGDEPFWSDRDPAGTDEVYGEGGDDTLILEIGDDTLDGGDGTDTLAAPWRDNTYWEQDLYPEWFSGLEVDLTAGTSEGLGSDIVTAFENVWGSWAADTLRGNASVNHANGRGGTDACTDFETVESCET